MWAQAQTPIIIEKNDFSGATVSSLSTFVPSGTTYTLELTGCVADQEITVPGGSFSYTPTASGTVRFVRNGGDVVYVYEGTTYKGTVDVSTPDDPTFPNIYGATDNSGSGTGIYSASNLFSNPGFETKGDKISDHNFKGTNWDCNGYTYSNKSRVRDNTSLSNQEGSCTFLMHGYGSPAECLSQTITTLKNFTPYQVKFSSWWHDSNSCTYKVTVGTSAGDGTLYNGEISTPSDSKRGDQSFTFTTQVLTEDSYVFAITRKTSNKLGNFDRMTLVAANGGGIGITGATGASFLSGSAYAPEGVIAAASEAGPVDVTSFITNAAVTSTTGWTNGRTNSGQQYTGAPDNTYMDTWNGTLDQNQTITLPAGYYLLKAATRADATLTAAANIYAKVGNNNNSANIHKEGNSSNLLGNGWGWTYVPFTVTEPSTVKIGFYSECGGNKWAGADNFTLFYYSSELNLAAAHFAQVVSEADQWNTKLGTTIPTAAKNALTAEDGKVYENVSDYNSAISRLETAIANARALVTPYAKYLRYKAGMEAIVGVTTTDATKAASRKATYIDPIGTTGEEATTVDAMNTVIANIRAAVLNYIRKLTPADATNAPFDLTFMIENPSFSENTMTGWSGTTPNFGNDATQKAAYACEYYQKEFDINQTLTDMVTGNYRLKVKAYQRPGGSGDVVPAYVNAENKMDGTFGTTSEIYVNGGNEAAQAIKNAASPMITEKINKGNESGVDVSGTTYYIPNDMVSAVGYFDAGYYENVANITATTTNIQFGFRSTANHVSYDWTIFDDFRLYYTGQLDLSIFASSLAAKVLEANTIKTNLSGKVPAGALTALQNVIDANDNDDDAFDEEEQFTEAITNISEAIAAAEAFETPYANYTTAKETAEAFEEDAMFADAWTALQDAISSYTISNEDLANTSITVETLNTAKDNFVNANNTATAEVSAKETYDLAVTTINGETNVNLTSLIVNPGFELGNTSGWTNDGTITANAQNNNSFDNKQDSYYCERWHVAGTIDINQTIAYLPAGVYKVEAYMFSDTDDAKLYANTTKTSVSTSGKYSVVIEIADKGSIKIGSSCTLTGSTWICLDAFTLTYLGAIEDLTYAKAEGKMGYDKSTSQDEAETTFLGEKNLTNYIALLDAISAAEASVANYEKLKAAIDKANDVLDKNNFVTAAATTAFQKEIEDATYAWTNETYTDAEATAEIIALGTAVSGHRGNKDGKAGNYMVSTWNTYTDGETNNWDGYYINTWSTEGDNDGSGFSVPFFEYWVSATNNLPAKTMTATLTDLPNGRYEIELWARVQRRSDADFNADGSMITMSVNGGTAVSIMNNTSNNVGEGGNVMRFGRYTAVGNVTDGTLTLTIDVKLGANVHWLCWRDVKYTKLGPAITISEDDTAVPTPEAIANVTLTRTLSASYWNTFSVPFDMAIPDGWSVKEFDSATDNVINFKNAESIVAGKPYLVKPTTDVENPFFESVNVKSTEGSTYGEGDYKFAAQIYNKSLATDGTIAYLATDGKIKKLNTASGLKGLRAYFIIPAGAAARINFIDDETTGISRIENSELRIENSVYNLQGQRVNKAQKGLYIKNGKKVVKK